MLSRVFLHVQLFREGTVVIHFDLSHSVVVKLKSLHDDDEDVRELLNAESLQGSHFFIAFLTEISIVSIEYLALNVAF